MFSLRHSRWFCFTLRCSVRHVSTFLRSLRSIPITGFLRYYPRSDSCRAGSSVPYWPHEHRSVSRQVSLLHAHELPSSPSPTTLAPPSGRFCTLPLSSPGLPPHPAGQDFTFASQAHRAALAESSSLSYGFPVHLRLLSTPPPGDAVTFGYKLESVLLDRDFHPAVHVRPQAHESWPSWPHTFILPWAFGHATCSAESRFSATMRLLN